MPLFHLFFSGKKSAVSACAYSKDGKYLAGAQTDGTIGLWKAEGPYVGYLYNYAKLLTLALAYAIIIQYICIQYIELEVYLHVHVHIGSSCYSELHCTPV